VQFELTPDPAVILVIERNGVATFQEGKRQAHWPPYDIPHVPGQRRWSFLHKQVIPIEPSDHVGREKA
jgi:hypothetical protein